MSSELLIVESPAKAGTIKKYLGANFLVLASYGHIRDLLPKTGAVDPEHDFKMTYVYNDRSQAHIAAILKAAANAKVLWLATDPDREGEAIAWHILELLKEHHQLSHLTVHRVVFHEITKTAVLDAVKHPRALSQELVNAQIARRALDYLVGFNLSPLLWKKIRYGLSAGRVQSPALRLIVTREEEVNSFKPREYWDIVAQLEAKEQHFNAKLTVYAGKKLTQFSITNSTQADRCATTVLADSDKVLTVKEVTSKDRQRRPLPPFTTSTLQQEASKKLSFSAKRTMSIAQKLYESGHITYMRTDSVAMASEAVKEIRQLIAEKFGAVAVPHKPMVYQNKTKNAQEAHEAIRPTKAAQLAESLGLDPDAKKLYQLIWNRAVASQMAPAVFKVVQVTLVTSTGDHVLAASGSTLVSKGFLALYKIEDEEEDGEKLPNLAQGDKVQLLELTPKQHFTEPPPFFTEASLVKALEAYGIGRPSTYATIIDTLLTREYVVLERKQFHPTDIGKVVNHFLTNYFTQYVDYDFTAHLEDELDEVAKGKVNYLALLKDFWTPFIAKIHEVDKSVSKTEVTVTQQLDEKCPKCGRPLQLKLGKKGTFVSCSGFPECDYARQASDTNIGSNHATEPANATLTEELCPNCQGKLRIIEGRFGKFYGCSNYPNCRYIRPLHTKVAPKPTGISCPQCKEGELVERHSRRNTTFYACNRFPKCRYTVSGKPVAESCPKCHHPILIIKSSTKGDYKACPQKDCDYQEGGSALASKTAKKTKSS